MDRIQTSTVLLSDPKLVRIAEPNCIRYGWSVCTQGLPVPVWERTQKGPLSCAWAGSESLILAAQEHLITTNVVHAKIDNT